MIRPPFESVDQVTYNEESIPELFSGQQGDSQGQQGHPWDNRERAPRTQARAFMEREEYILPVRLDDTEIPGILPTVSNLKWPPHNAETIPDAIMAKLAKAKAAPNGKEPFFWQEMRNGKDEFVHTEPIEKRLSKLNSCKALFCLYNTRYNT